MRLRNRLQWWEQHASPLVVSLIKHGLPADWILALPRPRPLFHAHATEEIQDALAIMQEYLEVKAVRRVNLHSGMHFVPWFMIYKPKPRFISACVDINAKLRPPPYFRLPNRGKIFPYLVKGHWALKIDLKHAYFRLALSPELRRYFNFQIGSNVFQCESACFGLHYIPYYWTQLMKTFSSKWRALGIVVFIYLDDIIILGPSEAGSDPRGHLGVTWGVYLCAGKPPLADLILSRPPELTRCDTVIGLAIPATSGHIQYRGAASGDLYIRISGINRVLLS